MKTQVKVFKETKEIQITLSEIPKEYTGFKIRTYKEYK